MNGEYEDIIHLPHHRSKTRSHMSMHDRAAQFSPFAALTGFESAICETERLTDRRIELDEDRRTELDRAIFRLQELLPLQPEVSVTYFIPDGKKQGGRYAVSQGRLWKLDLYRQILFLADGTGISLPDIIHIEPDCSYEV